MGSWLLFARSSQQPRIGDQESLLPRKSKAQKIAEGIHCILDFRDAKASRKRAQISTWNSVLQTGWIGVGCQTVNKHWISAWTNYLVVVTIQISDQNSENMLAFLRDIKIQKTVTLTVCINTFNSEI